MSALPAVKRAVGIVRVSETKGRDSESLHSPEAQRELIRGYCGRHGYELLRFGEPELDISGRLPLDRRPGLGPAVHAIEARQAEVIVAGDASRLFRNVDTQRECVRLVEAAGGEVHATDCGRITQRTASDKLNGTIRGAVDEFHLEQGAEKSRAAVALAVKAGKLPWPNVPPGYRKRDDGVLEPDAQAPIVRQAFELRGKGKNGTPIQEVQAFLAEHGIERSFHGVQHLLGQRIYLGEIHFGTLVNLKAHEPIVSRALFNRVQRLKVSRGRRSKSERLLARLGVLRCANCNARMVVGSANNSQYYVYRCPPHQPCPQRVTISATMVEEKVVDAVKEALRDETGRAEAQQHVRDAQTALEAAQEALDGALAAFTGAGLDTEPAAVERLTGLRAARDRAQEHVDQIGTPEIGLEISAATGWDRLTLDEQRALIQATVARVSVRSGRGADRITVELFGK